MPPPPKRQRTSATTTNNPSTGQPPQREPTQILPQTRVNFPTDHIQKLINQKGIPSSNGGGNYLSGGFPPPQPIPHSPIEHPPMNSTPQLSLTGNALQQHIVSQNVTSELRRQFFNENSSIIPALPPDVLRQVTTIPSSSNNVTSSGGINIVYSDNKNKNGNNSDTKSDLSIEPEVPLAEGETLSEIGF
jgi:hypothetical protein